MTNAEANNQACPHEGCGGANPPTARFCSGCGRPLEPVIRGYRDVESQLRFFGWLFGLFSVFLAGLAGVLVFMYGGLDKAVGVLLLMLVTVVLATFAFRRCCREVRRLREPARADGTPLPGGSAEGPPGPRDSAE